MDGKEKGGAFFIFFCIDNLKSHAILIKYAKEC